MKLNQLVVYSGPSCIGKGPILTALIKMFGEFARIILYTSRDMDPAKGEVQDVTYHFRSEEEIRNLDTERYIVGQVRSDWQAIDMEEVKKVMVDNDLVLVEIYPTLGKELLKWIKIHSEFDLFEIITVAIVPMSDEEIDIAAKIFGTTPKDVVYQAIRGKLERRGRKSDTPEKILERAGLAFEEIQMMSGYKYRIVNHAGEDRTDIWSEPLGPEAIRVVNEFHSILISEKK